MDEDLAIINSNTRNQRIKDFFTKNKKLLISCLIFLILILLGFYSYQIYQDKNKIKISDRYNSSIIKHKNGDNSGIVSTMQEIVENKDPTYSPLALYYLIDNELVSDKNKINSLFDILINKTSLDSEIKYLIIYKKALYNADTINEGQILEILNPIINSKSVWKSHALYLIAEDLSKIKQNNKTFDPLNNFGSSKYNGQLDKINHYKFSKLENFNQFNFEPLILNNGVIVFEKKGTIIRFNDDKKIVWKNNFYSKTEKKIHPILSFAITDKNLLVADSIAKISSINLQTGNLIWSKKSEYPFNSEIKIFKDKFFVVDFKNTLRCFYIKDGTECWNVKTEDSFTVSNSKFSMLIKDNLVIYNNSLGDITAVNISSGLIQWQLPTQTSSIMNETYGFNFSKLVSDGSSIYFSNNKNQFYSVDLKSGTTNWMNEINSILTPIIIDNFIFTVSENGYLFTIQKNEGNIIRINDIYKNFNLKKRKRIKPTGFTIGGNNLYLTNSDGNLIVISLSAGNILKIEKVGRDLISKPLIYNENLFIVKNGSITQYD